METQLNTRMALMKKIAAVKFEIGKINKSLENTYHKSSYFDINLLLDHVESSLTIHNLLLMQPIIDGYVVSQIIDLDSGEISESSLKLPELNDAQKIGSCITFYRRYALQSQLGIQAEDDDGNKASGKGERSINNSNQNNSNNQVQEPKKEWLNPGTDKWNVAVEKLTKGSKTMNGIKKYYNLSKPNEAKLFAEYQLKIKSAKP